MSKHTPGPWRVVHWQVEAAGATIADVYSWGDDTLAVRAEADANARLIAAAPELLEALIRCEACTTNDAVGQQARAAIAKATGEQQ